MNITSLKQKIGNGVNGLSHHAFLVEGENSENIDFLRDFLVSEIGFETTANPDYFEMQHGTFGIDESRELKEMQSRHSLAEGGKKVFLISANTYTSEAQNALLKVFEEPTEGTYFFVLAPSINIFLPTLLSRVVCVFAHTENVTEKVGEFLSKNYAERLELSVALAKEPVEAKKFIDDLTLYFYQKTPAEKRTPELSRLLSVLALYHTYAYGRSPSMKNLLEHLSLILPRE